MSSPLELLIYGVTGFTGRLVGDAAVAQGLRPVLAGRSVAVRDVADALSLPYRTFSATSSRDEPKASLDGVRVVLNCAGPFADTAAFLMRACIDNGRHYLDLAGEVAERRATAAFDAEARTAGSAVVPGVGFGIMPTDCAAVLAAKHVDDVQALTIGYETRGTASKGTLQTLLPQLHRAGKPRIAGRYVATRGGTHTRTFFDGSRRVRLTTNP